MKNSWRYTILLFFLFCSNVFADQKYMVKNNDTIMAIVSRQELTHIVFKGDEVDSIYSVDGEIEYARRDGKDLFFRVRTSKPINAFVKTKFGFVYKMLFEPKDVPATQIFVSNSQLLRIKDRHKAHNETLDLKIAQMVKFMRVPKDYLGYEFKSYDKTLPKIGKLKLRLVLQAQDEFLIGRKIKLLNTGKSSISFDKSNFMVGWLAAYLDKVTLEPGESTILILVKERDEKETI